jgi:hypothetical protein
MPALYLRLPKLALVVALAMPIVCALPLGAAPQEVPQPPLPPAGPVASAESTVDFQTTFCEGTYALCIKAPCLPIPTLDRIGNYYVERALCECEVVRGWSMGPGFLPLNGSIRRVYLPPELGDFFETFGEWRKGVRDIWDIGGYKRN